MCGILALFGSQVPSLETLHRRGPDETGTWTGDKVFLGHTRLSIVQPEAGPQPILWKDWVLVINGEIYNAGVCENTTDCYIVPPLLEKHGPLAPCHMDGIFSFVAYHKTRKIFIVARDAIGVTPLYMGVGEGGMCFSSLLAAIPRNMSTKVVPPGYSTECTIGSTPIFTAWSPPFNPWADLSLVVPDADRLIQTMATAVQKRITLGDVPWGVLLSGGLDSTIVAALACRLASKRPDYPRVHTFCTGLSDSPDVHWAEQVAHELGTHHTSVIYTVEEAVAAVPEVVRAVETYDVTTIRAATPMWLLARAIQRRGIKMVLSGEGSDELFAGYLYNLYCPSERHMADECVRKMEQLHSYDCARANKSMGDWGVETRVPFLDRAVVDFAMNQLHPPLQIIWHASRRKTSRKVVAARRVSPAHSRVRRRPHQGAIFRRCRGRSHRGSQGTCRNICLGRHDDTGQATFPLQYTHYKRGVLVPPLVCNSISPTRFRKDGTFFTQFHRLFHGRRIDLARKFSKVSGSIWRSNPRSICMKRLYRFGLSRTL